MTEWISVKDRLPEEGVKVLTYDPVLQQMTVDHILIYPEDEEEPYLWSHRLISDWNRITHWTELPEPPENI